MNERPYVLSIAGFDPCSGAGVTSDIKTFEQHKVYGLGAVTAITYQNESDFEGAKWLSVEEIIKQLIPLAEQYCPKAIKIGLIESAATLSQVLDWIKKNWPEAFIVWDPILKASAGFPFHTHLHQSIQELLREKVDLLTPNLPEYSLLFNDSDAQILANQLKTSILIKGGHSKGNTVCDTLYSFAQEPIKVTSEKVKGDWQKHGTGCILSAAIASEIALGKSSAVACQSAHFYVKKIIGSNITLLGYHYNSID
ncbi:hydroxymethylpyrimidine/phosphomethylpyrimidine kinase [Carboxylicivirga mesophila]|uniref:hydroxymethylpyrimidine kinase n=1 Tax=Carboxylicivirga mesophila TaxID=1166478 RepID=A0ABS5K8F1_9BACT|nr:hydroxymethylpyrimidine/phosphomethylpyrimidine kinase [Carboxylicivirga mesophila]MBS2211241.1 hydroxymethylpyrimidine/phosphomethylpyrimidine kinase [Carboxylicivirga mesophila]